MRWQLVCSSFALVASGALLHAAPAEGDRRPLRARPGGDQQAVIDCIARSKRGWRTSLTINWPAFISAAPGLCAAAICRSAGQAFDALRKGIALMDEAAAAAPNDAKVLLLRAVTNEALPRLSRPAQGRARDNWMNWSRW